MKKLPSLGVLCLFIGMTATTLAGSQYPVNGTWDRFVGAWRLASLEQEGADGKLHKADSTGLLVFTRDGHMSVQVMERDPPTQPPAGPEQYSQGGYEASFGTYEIRRRRSYLHLSHRGSTGADPYRQRPAARVRVLGHTTHCEVDQSG